MKIENKQKNMSKKLKSYRWVVTVHRNGPVCIMKWSDKTNVTMISTYYSTEVQIIINRGKKNQKPVCVIHYNQNMGGINKKEQLLQMYLAERKKNGCHT
jgi:hypothetical protein